MATRAQLKALRQTNATPTNGTDAFKQLVTDALAAAGIAAPLESSTSAGPHTVLALLKDADGSVALWAIPDDNIPAADRAHLDRIAGRCFEAMFTADLMPEQFAGALLVLVRTGVLRISGPEDGLLLEIAEAFEAEGVALPDADWATIGGDPWGGKPVNAGLGPIELTHFYCVHLAG